MTDEEKFNAYEKVRSSGIYNMIMQASDAAKAAGLTLDDYYWVIKNYNELSNKYE